MPRRNSMTQSDEDFINLIKHNLILDYMLGRFFYYFEAGDLDTSRLWRDNIYKILCIISKLQENTSDKLISSELKKINKICDPVSLVVFQMCSSTYEFIEQIIAIQDEVEKENIFMEFFNQLQTNVSYLTLHLGNNYEWLYLLESIKHKFIKTSNATQKTQDIHIYLRNFMNEFICRRDNSLLQTKCQQTKYSQEPYTEWLDRVANTWITKNSIDVVVSQSDKFGINKIDSVKECKYYNTSTGKSANVVEENNNLLRSSAYFPTPTEDSLHIYLNNIDTASTPIKADSIDSSRHASQIKCGKSRAKKALNKLGKHNSSSSAIDENDNLMAQSSNQNNNKSPKLNQHNKTLNSSGLCDEISLANGLKTTNITLNSIDRNRKKTKSRGKSKIVATPPPRYPLRNIIKKLSPELKIEATSTGMNGEELSKKPEEKEKTNAESKIEVNNKRDISDELLSYASYTGKDSSRLLENSSDEEIEETNKSDSSTSYPSQTNSTHHQLESVQKLGKTTVSTNKAVDAVSHPIFTQIDSDLYKCISYPEKYDAPKTDKTNITDSMSDSKMRKRVLWSDEEEKLLLQGVKRFGIGNWNKIKEHYNFQTRSNINLSDKYRNIVKYHPEKLQDIVKK